MTAWSLAVPTSRQEEQREQNTVLVRIPNRPRRDGDDPGARSDANEASPVTIEVLPPSVYIAGSAAEIERARHWHIALRAAGVTVVSSWIESVASASGVSNPRDATKDERLTWSAGCLREVDRAAVFWFLVPPLDRTTRGGWVEAGYAYALAKPMVFSGDCKQSIFTALGTEFHSLEQCFGGVQALCDDQAIREVIRLVGAR